MDQSLNEIIVALQNVNAQSLTLSGILQGMRRNEEQFTVSFNKKLGYEAIFSTPVQLRVYNQQIHDFERKLRDNVAIQDAKLQENVRSFQLSMERFKQAVTENMSLLTSLESQINGKITTWKYEQQIMSNGIKLMSHSIGLDQLQNWCRQLADSIWTHYEHLREAERMLQSGIIPIGNTTDLPIDVNFIQGILTLIKELLNHSLIVEEQPMQIVKVCPVFTKHVVVSLLTGKAFNIHMSPPLLSTTIINEAQARGSLLPPGKDNSGEIVNGEKLMEYDENSGRLTATLRNLKLRSVKRAAEYEHGRIDEHGNKLLVMEEKFCLQFKFDVLIDSTNITVSTMSLPVCVVKHGSQEPLATATILWDHAFGEVGRTPFTVPDAAPWTEVAKLLSAKFEEGTERGLTQENLTYLAQKVFNYETPQPAYITRSQFCKTNLPGLEFTFWEWFSAPLKLLKDANLKELYKKERIMGFIGREAAEQLISGCGPETFLLRFSETILGAISITYTDSTSGSSDSIFPYQSLDLKCKKLSMRLKDIQNLKYLYQSPACIPKDEAFGEFYDKGTPPQAKHLAAGLATKTYKTVIVNVPPANSNSNMGGSINVAPAPAKVLVQRPSFPELESHVVRDQPSPMFPQLSFSSPPPFHELQVLQGSDSPRLMSHSTDTDLRNALIPSERSQITDFINSVSYSAAPTNQPGNSFGREEYEMTNWYGDKLPPFTDLIRIGTNVGE